MRHRITFPDIVLPAGTERFLLVLLILAAALAALWYGLIPVMKAWAFSADAKADMARAKAAVQEAELEHTRAILQARIAADQAVAAELKRLAESHELEIPVALANSDLALRTMTGIVAAWKQHIVALPNAWKSLMTPLPDFMRQYLNLAKPD
jgi:hypothetical protein